MQNSNTLGSIRTARIGPLVKGIASFVPGLPALLPKGNTGGKRSATYPYQIWMKHLTLLWASGVRKMPTTMVELGPGDSLGVGLSAILSGVDDYCALDVVRFSSTKRNLEVFEGLVALFSRRASVSTEGWPPYHDFLDERHFASHILTEDRLRLSLAPDRLHRIRAALEGKPAVDSDIRIRYIVPWEGSQAIKRHSVDLILSHTVMQYVEDLSSAYQSFCEWLATGGVMSHQIDLSAQGLEDAWNGYRAFPELLWKLMAGRRKPFINREPYSTHKTLMERGGCELVTELKAHRLDGIARSRLSARWAELSDDDLNCSGAFVQAKKL